MRSACSLGFILLLLAVEIARAVDPISVDEIRAGMTGHGLTVVRGTTPERFEVEILGVLRQVQPSRDMVLARCRGLGMEKSGVAGGMSGSPVYIGERLLGAIAYTWEFGLEPIAGITPYQQMVTLTNRPPETASTPIPWEGRDEARGRLVPVKTPIVVRPLSSAMQESLRKELTPWNLVPLQGGAAGNGEEEKITLVPGSAMAVGMVVGDVQVTALGTVTAIEGDRVYALGHPFLQLGRCDLPLMGASVHAVLPLQSASMKLGSPLARVGRIDADVSTGIAGTIGGKSRTIPVTIQVRGPTSSGPRTLHCEVAWVPALFSSLFVTTLAAGLDAEGQAPAELTVRLRAKLFFASNEVIEIDKVFSGESIAGPAGLTTAISSIASLISKGVNNRMSPLILESVECHAEVEARRTSATIVQAWMEPAEVRAGDSTAVIVEFRPYRSSQANERRRYTWNVPEDWPVGEYRMEVLSGTADFSLELRRRPKLGEPLSMGELWTALREEASSRPTDLVLRIEKKEQTAAMADTELPHLPASVAAVLQSNQKSSTRMVTDVVRMREETPWPLEGSKSLTLRVVKQVGLRFPSEGNRGAAR
jgi:hypothetical protein